MALPPPEISKQYAFLVAIHLQSSLLIRLYLLIFSLIPARTPGWEKKIKNDCRKLIAGVIEKTIAASCAQSLHFQVTVKLNIQRTCGSRNCIPCCSFTTLSRLSLDGRPGKVLFPNPGKSTSRCSGSFPGLLIHLSCCANWKAPPWTARL